MLIVWSSENLNTAQKYIYTYIHFIPKYFLGAQNRESKLNSDIKNGEDIKKKGYQNSQST